jgi:hypothetical protein
MTHVDVMEKYNLPSGQRRGVNCEAKNNLRVEEALRAA